MNDETIRQYEKAVSGDVDRLHRIIGKEVAAIIHANDELTGPALTKRLDRMAQGAFPASVDGKYALMYLLDPSRS
jgi:hypothetical protein